MDETLTKPYQEGELASINLGGIVLNNQLLPHASVHLVLKAFNRHGLIAGATGSGKTKTIQVLCEQLSEAGVPSFVMDIKGDLSGLARPGTPSEAVIARCESLGLPFAAQQLPVEFLSLTKNQPGVVLRSTVMDFGPVLFSRLLEVNETQSGVLTVIFQFAKEEQIPLLTLSDLKSILQFSQTPAGKAQLESRFGSIAASSVGSILRGVIELESQGADLFFGQPVFDVNDLIRVNAEGKGVISVLRLEDMQDKPKLFSTFMLKLLNDLFKEMPEIGDPEKPKMVLFIDEAHLIFNHASKALLNLMETIVKLIRSKGIGLIFCTQTPNDIPERVLSQLGLKIQHALRAFSAKDRTALKLVAQNFPPSTYYDTEQLLTSLGIGEALVSGLDSKGQPTPLIQCKTRAPQTRMGPLSADELQTATTHSLLIAKYQHSQITPSAKAVLNERFSDLEEGNSSQQEAVKHEQETPSVLTTLTKNTLFRQVVRQMARDLFRALMSAFGIKRR